MKCTWITLTVYLGLVHGSLIEALKMDEANNCDDADIAQVSQVYQLNETYRNVLTCFDVLTSHGFSTGLRQQQQSATYYGTSLDK